MKAVVTVFHFFNCSPFPDTHRARVAVALVRDERIRTYLAPRVAHLLTLQGPGQGGKMRDPGNEVESGPRYDPVGLQDSLTYPLGDGRFAARELHN